MFARDEWLKGKNITTTNDCLVDSGASLSNKGTDNDDNEYYADKLTSLLEIKEIHTAAKEAN
eukprot:2684335-Ditylum_brightwellii.AAC.1